MKLNAFFLADHAEAVNGKLYVTGGCWDRIFAVKLPTVHPHLSVVVSILVPWQATNEKHGLELALVDADGNSTLPGKIGGEFELGRPPGWRPGDDSNLVAVFHLNMIPFNSKGNYAFVLKVDGDELSRTSLKVEELPKSTVTG